MSIHTHLLPYGQSIHRDCTLKKKYLSIYPWRENNPRMKISKRNLSKLKRIIPNNWKKTKQKEQNKDEYDIYNFDDKEIEADLDVLFELSLSNHYMSDQNDQEKKRGRYQCP